MKQIEGFPGYWVDKLGNVHSGWEQVSTGFGFVSKMHSTPIKCLKPLMTDGYAHVALRRNGRQHTRRIHLLVLTAYRGHKQPGQVARHLNSISTDNRLENLQWGSISENRQDANKLGHNHIPHPALRRLSEQDIAEIRATPHRKNRSKELADKYGVHSHYIDGIIAGTKRTYG